MRRVHRWMSRKESSYSFPFQMEVSSLNVSKEYQVASVHVFFLSSSLKSFEFETGATQLCIILNIHIPSGAICKSASDSLRLLISFNSALNFYSIVPPALHSKSRIVTRNNANLFKEMAKLLSKSSKASNKLTKSRIYLL